ncbi:hypothetical protein SELMODRAFT_406431 [Selaginella moellendorffii]|uniref:Uncharacterized protein n=1 Tax=Selaginella moellendorffii TaxID=88036 RepID=D8R2C4_SELML|nr:hypothetical protein SELMODRAFT_406431 [Selaginella moellendorffii]
MEMDKLQDNFYLSHSAVHAGVTARDYLEIMRVSVCVRIKMEADAHEPNSLLDSRTCFPQHAKMCFWISTGLEQADTTAMATSMLDNQPGLGYRVVAVELQTNPRHLHSPGKQLELSERSRRTSSDGKGPRNRAKLQPPLAAATMRDINDGCVAVEPVAEEPSNQVDS